MFIGRRADNSVYGLWTVRQFAGQEELPDDNIDVVAFVNRPVPIPKDVVDQIINLPAVRKTLLKAELARI